MKKTNPAREGNLFRIGGQDKKYFAQQGVDVFRVFTVLKKRIQFCKRYNMLPGSGRKGRMCRPAAAGSV